MIRHGFDPERHNDMNRLAQAIKAALDTIVQSISPRVYASFVANGANPATSNIVQLPAIKSFDGQSILHRATPGMKLIAAINLTDLTDVQSSFAQTISVSDQIIQLNTNNLSAKRITFILAS